MLLNEYIRIRPIAIAKKLGDVVTHIVCKNHDLSWLRAKRVDAIDDKILKLLVNNEDVLALSTVRKYIKVDLKLYTK